MNQSSLGLRGITYPIERRSSLEVGSNTRQDHGSRAVQADRDSPHIPKILMVNDNSSPESRALEAALRFLNFKPRTEGELHQKLTKLGFSQQVRENTCAYLQSLGLVDDERYTEEWILERSEKKRSSRKKILYELVSKGISKKLAEERLNQLYPPDLEVDKAAWVAQKFMRNNQDLSHEEMETKIKNFLFRKGFHGDAIKKVCRQLFQRGGCH